MKRLPVPVEEDDEPVRPPRPQARKRPVPVEEDDDAPTPPWSSPRLPHETSTQWLERMEREGAAVDEAPGRPVRVRQQTVGDGVVEVTLGIKYSTRFQTGDMQASVRSQVRDGESIEQALDRVHDLADGHLERHHGELIAVVEKMADRAQGERDDLRGKGPPL